ncbi:MAG: hypothetical protein NVS4B9_25410 [Ktedonobacteraceae bacterium]
MQALAAEHVRFLQRTPASAPSTPTPAFLAPYLKDFTHKPAPSNTLTAFSTATTGPLPVIRPKRAHPSYRMNHIAVLGLAASFLIILMTGGLTALLLMAKQGPSNSIAITNTSIHQSSQVDTVLHTTQAAYPNVASAVANGDAIYYTAYNNDATSWTLERLDNSSNQASTPLLSLPATNPLLVLGGTKDWLIWLQVDAPKQTRGKLTAALTENRLAGSWSLHASQVGSLDPAFAGDIKSVVLHKDSFDSTSVPTWVNTPIQGLWLTQGRLLVAFIDGKGISHLMSYQLDAGKVSATKELAHAARGHVLTSPTANSTGTSIYWSEEWMGDASKLIGKVWTQQIVEATPDGVGRWAPHTRTETYLFRPDENLFRPQIVNNTLFLLNSATGAPGNIQNGAQHVQNGQTTSAAPSSPTTPIKSGTTMAAQTTATQAQSDVATIPGGATKIDPTIHIPQVDETLAGTLVAFTADGAIPQSTPTDDNKPVSALQGGSRFLIWQNTVGSFEMYDVVTRSQVSINPGDIPRDAAFMAVNGDTAVWAVYAKAASPNAQPVDPNAKVTFGTFQWPSRQKGAAGA